LGLLSINKGTRIIIGVMVILGAIGLAIAYVHYGNINKAVDPRVREAHLMYGRYNVYASENNAEMVLALLDSIENIYLSVPHYKDSYEMGVVHNNRASVFLSRALSDSIAEEIKQHFFSLSEQHLNEGMSYYTRWIDQFGDLSDEEITNLVYEEFSADDSLRRNKNLDAIIRSRVKEILTAQLEMPRRMSVSYSNLGIIRRHENKPEEAIQYYIKALELWDQNHVAKNNMNILFGEPIEKQSVLRKLFPPDR
jgi:tetratricopeptide (TPR) repeat protein